MSLSYILNFSLQKDCLCAKKIVDNYILFDPAKLQFSISGATNAPFKQKKLTFIRANDFYYAQLIKSLKLLHNMCVELEKQIGECPVFNTQAGCPFKTICGDGKLMITHIEENTTTSVIKEVSLEVRQELEDELVSSMGIVLHHELEVKTMRKHRQTTKAPFIKAIMKGKLDVDSYKLFMYNMYFLYKYVLVYFSPVFFVQRTYLLQYEDLIYKKH